MNTKETWKPVTIGSTTGILIGAGTVYAVQAVASSDNNAEASVSSAQPANVVEPGDELSFSQAFDAARESLGAGGIFRWHGNVYTTYTKEEWDNMPHHEKTAFSGHYRTEKPADGIDTGNIEEQPTGTGNGPDDPTQGNELKTNVFNGTLEPKPTGIDTPPQTGNGQDPTPQGGDDNDVTFIGRGRIPVGSGEYGMADAYDINGQRVTIVDLDNDNVADVIMSDINHNGLPDEGEIIDLNTGEAIAFTNDDNDTYSASDETPDDSQGIEMGTTLI